MAIGRKLAWALLGTVTSKMVRTATRRAMHTPGGATRLPMPVRRRSGFGTALGMAVGTGAVMAIADVLKEQGKLSAQRRTLHGPMHGRTTYGR